MRRENVSENHGFELMVLSSEVPLLFNLYHERGSYSTGYGLVKKKI